MYRVQGTLREWVTRDEVRRFIARKFKDFLLTYKNKHGDLEYIQLINEMVLGMFWILSLACNVKSKSQFIILCHLLFISLGKSLTWSFLVTL